MSNVLWLEVAHDINQSVIIEHKLAYGSSFLPLHNRLSQTPSFVALIGGTAKRSFLRQVFASAGQSVAPEAHGNIHLWCDPHTREQSSPRVYIDCEIHDNLGKVSAQVVQGPAETHFNVSREGDDKTWSPAMIAYRLYSQVLAPFVNVYCFFSLDMGGLQGISKALASMIAYTEPPELPPNALPSALVFYETKSPRFDAERTKLRLLRMVQKEIITMSRPAHDTSAVALYKHFRRLYLIGTCRENLSTVRLEIATQSIEAEAATVSEAKQRSLNIFSFKHFKAFVVTALEHFSSKRNEAFDLVKAARRKDTELQRFQERLLDFLSTMPSQSHLWHFAVPMISSALLLDSHPPGMHVFPARSIFASLYASACKASIEEREIQISTHTKFLADVQSEFARLQTIFLRSRENIRAYQIHRQQLTSLQSFFSTMTKSHRTCFCCLMRMPEKVLSCGHALCDVCTRIFGRAHRSDKHLRTIPNCILCGASNSERPFRLLPPTAGIRLLSLDGGGVRGIITLTILREINEALTSLDCPLQDHFDLVFGTSSGGLIALGLFVLDWNVPQCIENFERLARRIFKRRNSGSFLLLRMQELVSSYLADCRYDSTVIEAAFQTIFGFEKPLFNPISNGTKVALTTTRVKDSHACILTNYNGGPRPPRTGYSLLRAESPEEDVSIADAARCTSAAPWFFKPKTIKSFGTYQDGGLRHNNPIKIALWEHKSLFPERGDPDFAISIGTGISKSATTALKLLSTSPVEDRFPTRLFKTLMNGMEGENPWHEIRNSLSETSLKRFCRLNPQLEGREPDIDDLSTMESLSSQAQAYINSEDHLKAIKDLIYASLFYFELEQVPEFDDERFVCDGVIYCRLNLSLRGKYSLYRQLKESKSYFLINGNPTPCVDPMPSCSPPFRKAVRFFARSLDDHVGISIRGITSVPLLISGSPKTLRELIDIQQLEAPFGRKDHSEEEKRLPNTPSKRTYPGAPASKISQSHWSAGSAGEPTYDSAQEIKKRLTTAPKLLKETTSSKFQVQRNIPSPLEAQFQNVLSAPWMA